MLRFWRMLKRSVVRPTPVDEQNTAGPALSVEVPSSTQLTPDNEETPDAEHVPKAYCVVGAGNERVNGLYLRHFDSSEDVPQYMHRDGFLLFRYRLKNGNLFWYISNSTGDLTKSVGDYYRIKSSASLPPSYGWTQHGCPAGVNPAPCLHLATKQEILAEERGVGENESPCMELVVVNLSGDELGTVEVAPSWTGAQVRHAVRSALMESSEAIKLIVGADVFDSSQKVAELGLANGSRIQAVVVGASVVVSDAGSSEVNGSYIKQEKTMNLSACYKNEAGTLLFKYIMNGSGASYWYFSREGNLDKSAGDYYRVKSTSMSPPVDGWNMSACPMGEAPTPVLEVFD